MTWAKWEAIITAWLTIIKYVLKAEIFLKTHPNSLYTRIREPQESLY